MNSDDPRYCCVYEMEPADRWQELLVGVWEDPEPSEAILILDDYTQDQAPEYLPLLDEVARLRHDLRKLLLVEMDWRSFGVQRVEYGLRNNWRRVWVTDLARDRPRRVVEESQALRKEPGETNQWLLSALLPTGILPPSVLPRLRREAWIVQTALAVAGLLAGAPRPPQHMYTGIPDGPSWACNESAVWVLRDLSGRRLSPIPRGPDQDIDIHK